MKMTHTLILALLFTAPIPVNAWQAFNDSANKNGGTDDETVTLINMAWDRLQISSHPRSYH